MSDYVMHEGPLDGLKRFESFFTGASTALTYSYLRSGPLATSRDFVPMHVAGICQSLSTTHLIDAYAVIRHIMPFARGIGNFHSCACTFSTCQI